MNILLIGLLLFLIAIVTGLSGLRFFLIAQKTTGEVVRVNNTQDDQISGYLSAPVVRYEIYPGKSFVYESSVYMRKHNQLDAGDSISVYFNPENPGFAFVGNWLDFFSLEKYAVLLGVILSTFGLYDYLNLSEILFSV